MVLLYTRCRNNRDLYMKHIPHEHAVQFVSKADMVQSDLSRETHRFNAGALYSAVLFQATTEYVMLELLATALCPIKLVHCFLFIVLTFTSS